MVSAGPGRPGFQPGTMPRFPAAPRASPAPPSGPMVGLTVKVTDKTHPKSKALFCFLNSSRLLPKVGNLFFLDKKQASLLRRLEAPI